MSPNLIAARRLSVLLRILNDGRGLVRPNYVRAYSSEGKVIIGDVSVEISSPKAKELVPRKYFTVSEDKLSGVSQSTLHHLRWMIQKDSLGQDMFLLGSPGPNRRKVALQYLEITQREMEYVALSRDTTEADLKQCREIRNSSAEYLDQSAVRAAIEGRVLLLEGIEKAERNVLPVLNNLLENREMHLEDGRFLVPAERYDKLLQEHGEEEVKRWRLVRVDERFRVIALGLPVPRYAGQPLDPPLRSRFQARAVTAPSYQEKAALLRELAPNSVEQVEALQAAAYAIVSPEIQQLTLPDFPLDSLSLAAALLNNNPHLPTAKLLHLLYPHEIFLKKEHAKHLKSIYKNLNIDPEATTKSELVNVNLNNDMNRAQITMRTNGRNVAFEVPCGERKSKSVDGKFVKTEYQSEMLCDVMMSHSVADFCIVGPKGCGKSSIVSQLAALLGYTVEPIVLYQDMTSRDLIQQRTTLENGDTVWRNSALVQAAIKGRMAVLDGLHRIHASTLAVLHRLVHDRELQLHDGSRLLRHDRYDDLLDSGLSKEHLDSKRVFRIHPAFRIVALAEPPTFAPGAPWLSPELLSLFLFHDMRNLSRREEMYIMQQMYGDISKPLHSIIELADTLRSSEDETLKNLSSSLSTRQLLRIASRMSVYPTESAYETIQRTFLAKFLPSLARRALETVCIKIGIEEPKKFGVFNTDPTEPTNIKCTVENGKLTIGNTTTDVYKTEALTKVPDILFYDVPQHVRLLEWLLQDFQLGYHLLLVGNQGVGKNKIADRLLQLMNRPREYIQLHRDTTVQSLTVQPTVKDGVVVYEDSPLVKAVKYGHVLVVDEADKAPTYVTCILKTLVEDGEMILSDGRRIVPKHLVDISGGDRDTFIPVHDDFRMIVLANRPGFPFLGNDFFGALGDLFSCHAVDNPSIDSEMALLKKYGPDVPDGVIRKFVRAFATLRELADRGQVTYPYSTREVVSIVKHLQRYPEEDLATVVGNVFDFDRYSKETAETLLEVLHETGLPTEGVLTTEAQKKKLQMTIDRKSGKDVKSPKHGEEDPDNKPHVGGNRWAGGTGGRDTAGLGGKGGPYRLDKGHDVHQLSDEEKASVPEHVRRAAQEMNRKAFEERLKEINMSEFDAKLYGQFLGAVQPQISALRSVLSELQAKKKERQWSRHQTSGDLDDAKIIEGLTGERTIYRRRTEQPPPLGSQADKPKRLRLVVDVSGSMYRFNSYDGRLERSMEAAVLLMEAMRGLEGRVRYDILGHSGETDSLVLVDARSPPQNEKDRLKVIRTMHAHAQFCWSGDNTVAAAEHAVRTLAKEADESDECVVVVLSDANLRRYGIPPETLARALQSEPSVHASAIFIGSIGDEADQLLRRLPPGRAHVCMDTATLPQILQQIFAASAFQPL